MIRCFTGKPGGGKSYRAMKEILTELVYGSRTVVTNMAIERGTLNAYLEKNHAGVDIDLFKRLRVLTDDEAREFWRYPGVDVDLPPCTVEDFRGKIQFTPPDLTSYRHVLFVIDEAHMYYDAQRWATEGPALTHINSQHRKWDWEIVFITQFPDLLSKRVRGFVQEWHNCRNYGLEKVLTVFRMPKRFAVKVTQNEPSRENQPGNFEVYIDLAVAGCYDTSAGVGIKGRREPEKRKEKGVSLVWLAAAGALGVGGMFLLPDMLAKKALGTESGGRLQKAVTGKPSFLTVDEYGYTVRAGVTNTAPAKLRGPAVPVPSKILLVESPRPRSPCGRRAI